MITRERLESLLAAFPKLRIALVGDLFLDRYLEVDPELAELSIETGLEAYQVTRIRNHPGALGTVMNNLAALSVGQLVPVTVIGDDGEAYDLLKALGRLPVDSRYVLQDAERRTPTYTKPLKRQADGTWRELNRIDLRNRQPLGEGTESNLLANLADAFESCDGLIVLDQVNEESWGVVGPQVRDHLCRLAEASPDKLIFIDSRSHIGRFRCGVLKPNLSECLAAIGAADSSSDDPSSDDLATARGAVTSFCRDTGLPLFCTVGPRGMLVSRPGEGAVEVPGFPAEGPIDIVGAGDSATAAIVASLLAGATDVEAATIGNLVASITVTQLGTTGTASPSQVLDRWQSVQ